MVHYSIGAGVGTGGGAGVLCGAVRVPLAGHEISHH